MKKIILLLVIILTVIILSPTAMASEPVGSSYFYNHNGTNVVCPQPYSVNSVFASDLNMINPCDMLVYKDEIYILDAGEEGNAKILVLNSDYSLVRSISFSQNNAEHIFAEIKSFWISNDEIYIVDRSGQAVFRADMNGNINQSYTYTTTDNNGKKNDFLPLEVVTDKMKNLYIMVENEYRGLLLMSREGEFKGYFGANSVEVTYDVILDNLWRTYFLSEKQIAYSYRNLPSPYLTVYEKGGFIYATNPGQSNKIVKLNYNENNILSPSASYGNCDSETESRFVSVAADDNGFFTAIDYEKKMLFQFDADGNLLYAFGGEGQQLGCFTNPISVAVLGDAIMVLDATTKTVTEFITTDFGKAVRELRINEINGKYSDAAVYAENILDICNEYDMAYVSLGQDAFLKGNYQTAMENFKKCGDQSHYSKAFAERRTVLLKEAFSFIFIAVILICVGWSIFKRLHKTNEEERSAARRIDPTGKLQYALHTVIHPIDGFGELHYNKRYSLALGNTCIFLSFLVSMLRYIFTGFSFSTNSALNYNLFVHMAQTIGVLVLFTVSNWLVATFLGGIGSLKEIWITVGYSQIPMIIGNIIYTVLSNVLTIEEGVFLGYLLTISIGYTYIMMLFAVMGVHFYSFKKTVFAVICTLFGMVVCVFLIFLTFNLSVELFGFLETLFREVIYRINVGF